MRKLLQLKTLILLICVSFATTASAYDFYVNGIYYNQYTLSSVEVTYKNTAYNSYSGYISIPSSINVNGKTYAVIRIGDYAFKNCTGVTGVSLPSSISSIGTDGFAGSGLVNANFPNSLTEVGASAFMDCKSLKNVTFGTGLTEISPFMFIRCTALEYIAIPNSITRIRYDAFQDCSSLKTVSIGTGITAIEHHAFAQCSALKWVTCLAPTPPSVTSTTFLDSNQSNVGLYVTYLSINAYKNANYWKDFKYVTSAYDFYSNGIYYSIRSSNTVAVTYRDGDKDNYTGYVTIPSTVTSSGKTYTVTTIGYTAFQGSSDGGHVTGVSIPNTVTTIEHDAFWLQKKMTSVNIPSSVTTIDNYAFCWCSSLTSITIPNSVTTLGKDAFAQCKKLTSVTLGSGITKIDDETFCQCEQLTSISIPGNIKSIGYRAFEDCKALGSVTIGAGVTSIGSNAFNNCPALTAITCWNTTPPSITSSSFTSSQYSNATLRVPVKFKSAYQSATNWKNFTKYSTLTYDMYTSSNIYFAMTSNNTCEVTYRTAEYNSYSGAVAIPTPLTFIGTTYSVTAIGEFAFKNSESLTSVSIPSSVTYIGNWAFDNCYGLTSITIPNSVTSVGLSTFLDCKALQNVAIGSGLKKLSDYMFCRCINLTEISIPDNITELGTSVFENDTKLKKVTLGTGMKTIGNKCFAGCSVLKTVVSKATNPPTLSSTAFDSGTYSSGVLYVPYLSQSSYKAANYWKNFSSVSTVYDFVVNGIYYNKTGSNTAQVTFKDENYDSYSGSVSIPSSVSYGGTSYSVTAIGQQAFRGTSSTSHLTAVTIPNSVKTINDLAFWMQYNLGNVTIPSSVTTIGNYAFCWCSNMTSVTIPNSVTSLGGSAFAQCKKLTSVTIGTGLTKLEDETFYLCEKLTSITVPNNIKTIGNNVFQNCNTLKTVVLGTGITSIGKQVFNNCSALTALTSNATTPPTLQSSTFDNSHYSAVTLTVPYTALNAYKAANYWKNFTHMVSGNAYDFTVGGIYYTITGSNTVSVTYKNTSYNSYSGSVTIPASVTYGGKTYKVTGINEHAFEASTGLTAVTIPEGITTIGLQAFYGCKALTTVTLPSTVTSIPSQAFGNCSGLKTLTLGSGISSLASQAFTGCNALTSVTVLNSTPPTMSSNSCFTTTAYSNATLYVPGASVNAYKLADWWRMFATIKGLSFDFCVNGIYYKKLSSSTVEVTYKDESYNSYSGSITVPSTIKVGSTNYAVVGVGTNAFWKSTGLTSVQLPATVTSIGEKAFAQCTALKTATLGTGVKTISQMAFSNCTALTSITIPSKVTKINNQTFEYCKALTQLTLPDAITSVGTKAFYNCTGLKTLKLGTGLTTMGSSSFAGCTALTSITCGAKTPPKMTDNTVFSSSTYNSAKLYVPRTSVNAYKLADWWRLFVTITGVDMGTEPADVNGDGEITIADVNDVINCIITGGAYNAALDVNGDGEITINDVNIIIDKIIHGS